MRVTTLGVFLTLLIAFWPGVQAQGGQAPPVALANVIHYQDAAFTDLPGNGFLLDAGDEVLAVTCKHVLWENRPQGLKTVDLSGRVREWRMIVRNEPTQYVILGELINPDPTEAIGERNVDQDYLVFKIKENHAEVKPLKISPVRVKAGDALTWVGWTFRAKEGPAQVRAAVAAGYSGPQLLMKAVIPQNDAGASGSPVCNSRGELVGIVSSWKFSASAGEWLAAPCSVDALWIVLYQRWLSLRHQVKSVESFRAFLRQYDKQGRLPVENSSFLLTKLFYADWLKVRGLTSSPAAFARWADEMRKKHGLPVVADDCLRSRLVFDAWKGGYAAGQAGLPELEQTLRAEQLPFPDAIEFCEFAQDLTARKKTEAAIALLLFTAKGIQHVGQVYAYLGDAYRAKGETGAAGEAYRKCLETYPGYPMAVEGIAALNQGGKQ